MTPLGAMTNETIRLNEIIRSNETIRPDETLRFNETVLVGLMRLLALRKPLFLICTATRPHQLSKLNESRGIVRQFLMRPLGLMRLTLTRAQSRKRARGHLAAKQPCHKKHVTTWSDDTISLR